MRRAAAALATGNKESTTSAASFNTEIVESINTIVSITNSMIGDLDAFNIQALVATENIHMLGEVIVTLPGVVDNPEVLNRVLQRMRAFDNRISQIQQAVGDRQEEERG